MYLLGQRVVFLYFYVYFSGVLVLFCWKLLRRKKIYDIWHEAIVIM